MIRLEIQRNAISTKTVVKAKLESQIRFLKLTERDEVKDAISKLES